MEAPSVGEHHIVVRVVDSAGQPDPTPVRTSFRVVPVPLQSRPWFGPTVVAVFAVIVSLAAFALFARHKLSRHARDLERVVVERTRALLGSEVEYRTLFEESRDAIVLCDAAGRVQDANPAAIESLGLAASGGSRTALAGLFDQPLDLETTSGGAPVRLTREAGSRSLLLSVTRRRDSEDRTVGYLVIARDVTMQMRLEEQLSHAQKMEAVGRMAGGVAHEFNNILTAILGHCELLRREAEGDTALSEVVDVIHGQAQRAKDVTGRSRSSVASIQVGRRSSDSTRSSPERRSSCARRSALRSRQSSGSTPPSAACASNPASSSRSSSTSC